MRRPSIVTSVDREAAHLRFKYTDARHRNNFFASYGNDVDGMASYMSNSRVKAMIADVEGGIGTKVDDKKELRARIDSAAAKLAGYAEAHEYSEVVSGAARGGTYLGVVAALDEMDAAKGSEPASAPSIEATAVKGNTK